MHPAWPLGEDSTPSEASLAVHVQYLDHQRLHQMYASAVGIAAKLEICRAGWSNLNLWCAWLRGAEHFDLCFCDVESARDFTS